MARRFDADFLASNSKECHLPHWAEVVAMKQRGEDGELLHVGL